MHFQCFTITVILLHLANNSICTLYCLSLSFCIIVSALQVQACTRHQLSRGSPASYKMHTGQIILRYDTFSSWLPASSGSSVLTVKPLKWGDGVLFYLGTFAMSVILLDTCLSPTIVLLHNIYVIALCSSPQPIHSFTQSLLKKNQILLCNPGDLHYF